MTDMITRCPKCSTAFRITPTQLKSAKGAVRCGSCLHIFKALEHLVESNKPKAAASTQDDDDLLISDDMGEEKEAQWDFNEAFEVDTKPAAPSLFERKQKPQEDEPEDDHDESWAENLLHEAERDITKPSLKITAKENLESAVGAPSGDPSNSHTSSSTSNHANTFAFADTEEPETNTEPKRKPEKKRPSPVSGRTGDYQFNFEPAPLDIQRYQEHGFFRKLLWPTLVLLTLVGLAGQIGYYKFDSLSVEQPYRDIYAKVCPHLGCQLPKLSAPEKISTYNLVVREHPSTDNALMIDIILLNRARFDQPFPKLRLNFADLNNKPLAARTFTPNDYLAGELAGKKMMPANSPVHISLEVVDPGQDAVNYSAQVLSES